MEYNVKVKEAITAIKAKRTTEETFNLSAHPSMSQDDAINLLRHIEYLKEAPDYLLNVILEVER